MAGETVKPMKTICSNCWWLSDRYTSVCVNERSPHCGEFVRLDDSCLFFDADEEKIKADGGDEEGI